MIFVYTSFACYCRSRIPPGRGGCMRYTRGIRNTRWKVFRAVRFLQRSQKPARSFSGMIVEAPKSMYWQFDPWKLNSAFIPTSQLQPLLQLHTMAQLIQATTICGAHGWVQSRPKWKVVSYQWYKYNNDLSEGLSVINNTTKTTWVKSCQSSIIWVQKWLVWLSFSINVWWPIWSLACVAYDLWSVWSMICMFNGLYSLWPV